MASNSTYVSTYGKWYVYVDQISQDVSNWRSRIRVRLYMKNLGTSRTWNNDGAYMSISNDASWSNTVPFDVSAGAKDLVVDQYFWITHNSNGTKSITIRGTLGSTGTSTFGNGGYVDVNLTLDSLATAPSRPTSKTPYNVKHTEMTFDIDDGSDGGSSITGRYYAYSRFSDFRDASWWGLPSNGTVVRGGLSLGTKYYFKGYVKNAVGNSSESTIRSATTLSVPSRPTSKTPYNVKHTEMTFDIDDAWDGGSSITGRYYKYSRYSNFSGASWIWLPSNGRVVRGGLSLGTKYYFKGYVKNVGGNSSESTIRSATTLSVPDPPYNITPYNITHTEMTFDIADAWDGGSSITGRYYKYSNRSDFYGAPWIWLPYSGTVVRGDLLPGTRYYFKAYVKNVGGNSSDSIVRSATTLAGVYVRSQGFLWLGVFYGKYNDVWYPGVPYGKTSDVWKPAAS